MKSRRRSIVINPAFQLRFGLYMVTMNLGAAAILVTFYVHWMVGSLSAYFVDSGLQSPELLSQIQSGGAVLFTTLMVLNLIAFLFSVRQSHRIIGPIMRFEKHVEGLLKDQTEERIRLREGDHFQDLAVLLNRLSEKRAQEKKGV